MDVCPPVVVHPPESVGGRRSAVGGRRLTIHGARVGIAYSLFDVLEFLHCTGLPAQDRAVDDPELIEWRVGGPYGWNSTA
ncbi:hypothetical protein OH738_00990 [Streptomyces hirsutus]|uniref:hypothetical protein n=1 Tax=Streptomyces hirsutus TaxID=35620 RepID=UPI0038697942|nr:hypothetical protein OH738_00990 [Streptomyces hirsutus]